MKDKVWFTFKARIQAHKRLEWLDFHSQTLLVWYAFLSTVLCVLTIRYPHILGCDTDVMATVLSVALLGVSLAVTNRDFRGRAMAMRSNYLQLQNLYNVLDAQNAAGNPATPAQISQYADLLAECENHREVDDRIARVFASNLSSRHPTGFEHKYAYYWLTLRLITTTALYALPLIVGLIAWGNHMSAARSFNKHFARKPLLRIYTDKIKISGAIGLDRMRPAKLDENLTEVLEFIIRKAHEGTYRFTAYKEKLILKGATSTPRQISIPTARDRIVLRALCDSLAEVFPAAKLSLPQEVIDDLKEGLKSGKYAEYAKIDLKNFYPSIPHSLIKSTIWKKVRKPQFRHLIESAITTPTVPESKGRKDSPDSTLGVPQGLAISNLLAEIALQDIDAEFKARRRIWYKRYVDDILILAPNGKAKRVADDLIAALKGLGLSPHDFGPESKSKVADLTEPFSFLGYQIDGDQIKIRHESILRFESSLAKIFTAYRHKVAASHSNTDLQRARAYCEWKVNLRITGCFFEGKRRGWASYFSQITSTTQLRSVNHTIRKLTQRFSLEGKIQTKSLIKTFYELKRGKPKSHSYIPNLDDLDIGQKRSLLAIWVGDGALSISDARAERLFEIKVTKAVRELEEDIAQAS